MRGVKCMTDTHTSSTRRATPPSPNLEMNPICVEAPLGSFLFFVFFFFHVCVENAQMPLGPPFEFVSKKSTGMGGRERVGRTMVRPKVADP